MITTELLIKKGLTEPKGRYYCYYSESYCKLLEIGLFLARIKDKKLQVFERNTHELITTIKKEDFLDIFLNFALYEYKKI